MSNEPENSISRKIVIGVAEGIPNMIATTKYSALTFLPLFLFDQFRQFANFFFLIMAIIQASALIDRALWMNPQTSPYGPQSCSVPLLVIILVAGMKEVFEDYKRRKSDKQVNYQVILAYDKLGGWREITYSKLQAGMIVYVTKGASFPADLVLLSSSEPAGIAYIETSNLDGETNLKIRKGLPQTASLVQRDNLTNCLRDAVALCEQPNKRLYSFQGSMQIASSATATATATVTGTLTAPPSGPNNQDAPLDKSQFLQRGAKLRNTDWVYGLVVYAGKETKCMLNSVRTKRKNARIHQLANYLMMCQFGMLLMVTIIYTYMSREPHVRMFLLSRHYNLKHEIYEKERERLHVDIISFLVTFSSLVPISLFVTINTIQLFQAFLIRTDLEMYDPNNDIAADARNSMLTAELGEVKYVMADKTGTLTRNKMVFKNCSVGGVKYGSKKQESFNPRMVLSDLKSNRRGNAEDLQQFLTACAVCHTVVPEKKGDTVVMHASSPDEYALVNFAYNAGFKFHTRTPTMTVFTEILGETSNERQFEVLQVLEFDSVCKRMGVVVKREDGSLRLYVKGADSAVTSLLSSEQKQDVKRMLTHLEDFAKRGLRTLCFAYRDIDHAFYTEWARRYQLVLDQNNTSCRAELMHQVEEDLVRDMKLIGASAIEDRLQEKVPETISKILSSGMHLWMLTGDKLETAINIGFSCNLISNKVTLLVLKSPVIEEVATQLRTWLTQIGERRLQKGLRTALVVESSSLDLILNDVDLTTDFLRLALASHAVICCRCTPLQKASVTRLVRTYSSGCVLAVGDGGNDIAMIQEAHVGVGIHGQEGNQAAMSADFSIAQFKHLDRLLFVHGSLSLFRTNRTLLYTIYKNTFEMAVVAFFSAFTGFTIQVYTDSAHIICYALWYTCFPALMIGMFDRPVSIDVLATSSSQYAPIQNSFSIKEYIKFLAAGVLHSFVVFISNHQLYGHLGTVYRNGREMYLGSFGFTVLYCLVAVANVKALYESRSLNWPMYVSLAFSVITPILVMAEQSMSYPHLPWSQRTSAGLLEVVPNARFFLFIVYILGTIVMLEICFKGVYRLIMRRVNVPDEYHHGTHMRLLQPLVRVKDLIRNKDAPRTGYAFSQDDGSVLSQSEMVKAYDSTVPKTAGCELSDAKDKEKQTIESNRASRGSLYNDKTVDSEGSPQHRSDRAVSKSKMQQPKCSTRPPSKMPSISEETARS